MAKRVTLTEIAKKAGVSQPVASMVLCGAKGSMRVRPELAAKVVEIANDLGYRPNLAARATATGRFNMVALVQSTQHHRSLLPQGLLDGIQMQLTEQNMHLVLAPLPDEELIKEGVIPKIFNECMCDGALINYNSEIPPEMEKLVLDSKMPAIWINSKHEKNCVYPNDYEAAVKITEKMIQDGHTRIVYLNFIAGEHYSNFDRQAGYNDTMITHGLKPETKCLDVDLQYGKNIIEMVERSKQMLQENDHPTAFIIYGPESYWPMFHAAEEIGLKVPEDLFLITFDEKIMYHVHKKLPTAVIPEEKIGQEAVKMVLSLINEEQENYSPMPVDFSFAF